MRVLIVEDDPDSSDCLDEMLRFWGHETRIADSAAEALSIAHEMRPEVALLDFQLPDLDGPELARKLRQDPPNARIFLVMITAFAFLDYAERTFAAGIDRFMTKPVDYPILEQMLAEAKARVGARN